KKTFLTILTRSSVPGSQMNPRWKTSSANNAWRAGGGGPTRLMTDGVFVVRRGSFGGGFPGGCTGCTFGSAEAVCFFGAVGLEDLAVLLGSIDRGGMITCTPSSAGSLSSKPFFGLVGVGEGPTA